LSLEHAITAFRHLATDPTKNSAIPKYLIIHPKGPLPDVFFGDAKHHFFVTPAIAPFLKPLNYIQIYTNTKFVGGYAEVTKATYVTKSDPMESRHLPGIFARKEISKVPRNDKLGSLREAHLLVKVNHPCLLKLLGVALNKENHNPILLTKFYLCTSLQLFRTMGKNSLDDTQTMIMIYGIAHGMDYLHSRRILHRDLNPGNILVDDIGNNEYRPVICDFGLSKELLMDSMARTKLRLMRNYQAPEFKSASDGHSWSVDRWCFGVMLSELLENPNKPEEPPNCPDSFTKIIKDLTNEDPQLRPSFQTVLEGIENGTLMLPNANCEKVMNYVKELQKLEVEFLNVELENHTETIQRRNIRNIGDLAKAFAPHLFPGQFRIQTQDSTNRTLPLNNFIFRCEKRNFKMEFSRFVVSFVCGDTIIPIVTQSKQIADFRKLLFPNLMKSIKIDFYQQSTKIEETKYLRSLDLRLPITITATRLFIINFQDHIERIPFSQCSRVSDFKSVFAFRYHCSINCLTVTSTGENREIFQNVTLLWNLPDELIFILEDEPFVSIIIDGEIEKVKVSQTVSQIIELLELNWIKGNEFELYDDFQLINVPDEMILTASRKGEKIYIQAGDFKFEVSNKQNSITSETLPSIIERLFLRVYSNQIIQLQNGRTYKVKNIPIQVKVIGFFQEVIIDVRLFWSVGHLQEIVENRLQKSKCILTFLCRKLDQKKPLSFYGIQNDSEIRVIQDSLISVLPESLLSSIKWSTLPGEGIPFVFVTPDSRLIVWRFQPQTTLQEAAHDLENIVGYFPIGFRVKSEVFELSRKLEFLPSVIHLFITLDIETSMENGTTPE
jgi:serine/threonine protein kinase